MAKLKLGIDCEPGTPRPELYARTVFTKLETAYIEPYSKLFGAWEWLIPCTKEQWEATLPWLKPHLQELYEQGRIRGAMWEFIEEEDTVNEKEC